MDQIESFEAKTAINLITLMIFVFKGLREGKTLKMEDTASKDVYLLKMEKE